MRDRPVLVRGVRVLALMGLLLVPGLALASQIDVDGNGSNEASTDGILVVRYLFGFRGDPLVSGAIGSGATRTSAAEIETYLEEMGSALDVDGNGARDALTDGVLILRYLLGFSGTALTDGAVGLNATVNTSAALEAYLMGLTGAPVFVSDLALGPDVIFVSESKFVVFAVALANPENTPTVDVLQTDDQGVGSTVALTLYDDGDLSKGDDIAGDGVYHNNLFLTPGDTVDRFYVAQISASGLRSGVTRLTITEHLTQAAFQQTLDMNQSVDDAIRSRLDSGGSWDEARADAVALLEGNPTEVLDYVVSEDGNRIVWVSESGLLNLANMTRYLPGNKGGGRRRSTSSAHMNQSVLLPELFPGSAAKEITKIDASKASSDSLSIGNRRALILAPYFWKFENGELDYDESDNIATKLSDAGYDVTYVSNPNQTDKNVTLENFKNLHEYGIIVWSTHGDNWVGPTEAIEIKAWAEFFWNTNYSETFPAENLPDDAPLIYPGHHIDRNVDFSTYEEDLKSLRLILGVKENDFLITPGFIRYHSATLPNSIVYASSCRSTFTNKLAQAFFDKGAAAYFGYSDYVHWSWAAATGRSLFDQLLSGDTTGQIDEVGDTEPWPIDIDPYPAEFQRYGSTNLNILVADLTNGDFEDNLAGWEREGDVRVITNLGTAAQGEVLKPPQGSRMAIVSTGLGAIDESYSRIVQTFKVGTWDNKLKLRYDVVSEEPMEFVGGIYDDRFEVYLGLQGEPSELIAFERVNVSTWLALGADYFAGGDLTTFHTGWTDVVVDVSDYKGQFVTLEIVVSDVGDSAYDTAALIDNIRLTLF